jgi:putative DNA primase/helicase
MTIENEISKIKPEEKAYPLTKSWDDLPAITTKNRELHDLADEATEALVEANDLQEPEVMTRGDDLVRITGSDPVRLEPYSNQALRNRLSQSAHFGYHDAKTGGWKPVFPPDELAPTILHRAADRYQSIPRVFRVTDVPVFGADGSLVIEPGFHPSSGIYYRPAPEFANWTPRLWRPGDWHDLDSEVSLLPDDLLGDFPFEEEADRTNALALLLLPFVREMIPGPTPLHALMAPEHGTGKSLLAEVLLIPSCGTVARSAVPVIEEEWQKVLTSALILGQNAILFDNAAGKIDSQQLANALTSVKWSARILGVSRMATLEIRNAWAMTINNGTFSTEIARRVAPVYLNANMERPWERTKFQHSLPSWARQHRRDLVQAALTIAQSWATGHLTPGTLEPTGQRFYGSLVVGSYEEWSRVMGGMLVGIGYAEWRVETVGADE